MSRATVEAVARQIQTILTTDGNVQAGEARKFTAAFAAQGQAVLGGLSGAESVVKLTASERQSASEQMKTALAQGEEWIRSVHGRIAGLAPKINKQPIFTAYGFESGNLGALDSDRVLALLKGFAAASAAQKTAAAQLPADWLPEIATLQAEIERLLPLVSTGTRGQSVKARDVQRAAAEDWLSRVFGWLVYALPLRDRDPLMRDYGFEPRKMPSPKAKPAATPTP